MFSKFKVDKPQANVLYKRGPRHFEVEQSVLSLPLLEAYDQRIRHLHEIVSDQATELEERRAEVFRLRQELQLVTITEYGSYLNKAALTPGLEKCSLKRLLL